jgi:hypothetical protein
MHDFEADDGLRARKVVLDAFAGALQDCRKVTGAIRVVRSQMNGRHDTDGRSEPAHGADYRRTRRRSVEKNDADIGRPAHVIPI